MDPLQIKAIIDAMASSDIAEMEFSQDGWTLRLVRGTSAGLTSPPSVRPGVKTSAPGNGAFPPREVAQATSSELHAPLYGVVYLQASPDEPPFVTAGLAIKAGQTLCVIEAMKVLHEVRAERDATVQAVLVTSGQEVEAGQPLLRFA